VAAKGEAKGEAIEGVKTMKEEGDHAPRRPFEVDARFLGFDSMRFLPIRPENFSPREGYATFRQFRKSRPPPRPPDGHNSIFVMPPGINGVSVIWDVLW
jgi:hypothetical protein